MKTTSVTKLMGMITIGALLASTAMAQDSSEPSKTSVTTPIGTIEFENSYPTKGWNMLWRIYGPTQVWYDKGWRPSEIEMVN